MTTVSVICFSFLCGLLSALCKDEEHFLSSDRRLRALRRSYISERRWQAEGGEGEKEDESDFPAQLVLEMLIVSISNGASIPRSLEAVGTVMKNPVGKAFKEVAEALYRGSSWADAWELGRRGIGDERGREVFDVVDRALEPSWRHGLSPLNRLETTIEEANRQQNRRLDDAVSKLSVKILLPLGLCFLPAFIVVTVLPSLAGWITNIMG